MKKSLKNKFINKYNYKFLKIFLTVEEKINYLIEFKKKYNMDVDYELYFILNVEKNPNLIMKYFSYITYGTYKSSLLAFCDDLIKLKGMSNYCEEDIVLIIKSFKSDRLRLDSLNYVENEIDRYQIISYIKDEALLEEGLSYLKSDFYKKMIIQEFKDERRMAWASLMLSSFSQRTIVEKITSDEILKELYFEAPRNTQVFILEKIKDNVFKYKHFEEHTFSERLDILITFTDYYLLAKILKRPEYVSNIKFFINFLNDNNVIEEIFEECDAINNKLDIIKTVQDEGLRKRLIEKLDDGFYRFSLESNYLDEKEELVSEQDISDIKLDIDNEITFGVELETCSSEYYSNVLGIDKILSDWKISYDATVNDGVEIISPILRFCSNDLKKLKFVCNLLDENGFYIDNSCGGHIHFGFSYFKDIDEFNTFLNLYSNVEDIIYLICNHSKSKLRPQTLRYAKKIKPILEKVIDSQNDWICSDDLNDYADFIKSNFSNRYYGMNLKNINSEEKNTIEFRMPNGEINFDELIINIRLFAKLMEKSREINNILKKENKTVGEIRIINYYEKLISVELTDRTKICYLLNILFDGLDERNCYYKRYVNNYNLNYEYCDMDKKTLCLKRN